METLIKSFDKLRMNGKACAILVWHRY